MKLNQKKIFKIKNNNYFLIDNYNKDILIGNINNKLIFIPKYNLYYKTPEILNQEKEILLEKSIEEYINIRNYNENNMPLIKENKEMIGELTIVKDRKQTNNNNKVVINTNQNPKKIMTIRKNRDGSIRNETSPNSKNKAINFNSNNIKFNQNLKNSIPKDKDKINYRNFHPRQIKSTSNINRDSIEKSLNNSNDIIYNSEIINVNKLNNISKLQNYSINNLNNNFNINQNIINNNGQNIRESRQLENKLKNNNELNKRIQNKNNEQENMIYQLNQEINKLKMDNKNKDNEIIMLKNNINEKYQNSLNQLQNKINILQNEKNAIIEENTKLKNELINNKALKDKELVIMNQKLQQYEIILNKLEKVNEEKENIIKSQEIINNNKKEEFENILKEKENEINNRLKEILELKERNDLIYKEFQNQIRLNNKYKKKINELENELNEMNINFSNYKNDMEKEVNKLIRQISEKEKDLDIKTKILKEKESEIEKKNNEEKELNEKFGQKLDNLNKIIENEPITLYYQPTLVGLNNNIEATRFMNSTLQCLSQTDELTNFFLK